MHQPKHETEPPWRNALILVTVRENEPFEKALRRFRRKVEREGIRKDIKKNSFYLKPGEKRRLKQRLAEKRRRKAIRRAARRASKSVSRPKLR
jgi:small subunit ribosomal protein S21